LVTSDARLQALSPSTPRGNYFAFLKARRISGLFNANYPAKSPAIGEVISLFASLCHYNWVVAFDEYDTASNPRVSKDWQLPNPPKGLPNVEEGVL
jgi:hypothetical protein